MMAIAEDILLVALAFFLPFLAIIIGSALTDELPRGDD